MSLYDNFNQKDLVDLLKAYDSYISNAAEAGLLTTGWTLVCVEEFYHHEYQNVWDPQKGDASFDYMYEPVGLVRASRGKLGNHRALISRRKPM